MKKFILFFTFSLFFPTSLFAETVDKILVIINDQVITQSEVDRAMSAIYMQLSAQYEAKELENRLAKVKQGILKQMIEEKLILSEAKKYEIKINDKDIDAMIKDIKSKSNISDDEDFEEALAEQGISLKILRDKLSEQAIIRNIVHYEVASKVTVSPQEMISYYDAHRSEFKLPPRVHLFGILIKKDENQDKNKVLRKAEFILRLLKQGADFRKIARQRSQDSHAQNGGDMGILEKGHLMSQIEDAVFNLQKGAISEIVETPAGFYIFKVEEILPEEEKPFAEVEDKIESVIFGQKFTKKYEEWIETLEANAQISIK